MSSQESTETKIVNGKNYIVIDRQWLCVDSLTAESIFNERKLLQEIVNYQDTLIQIATKEAERQKAEKDSISVKYSELVSYYNHEKESNIVQSVELVRVKRREKIAWWGFKIMGAVAFYFAVK